MNDLIPNFKKGPLDEYRQKATFDWKKLKIFLHTEDVIKYENQVYAELESHPEFKKHNHLFTLSFDEERRIASRQSVIFNTFESHSLPYMVQNFKFHASLNRILTQFTPSSTVKHNVSYSLFTNTIQAMGSDRHQHYIDNVNNGNISGCYCLTEIGHGSNAKGMQTTATYNKEKRIFILNSKDFESAKCWAGGLGQSATHAIVYAQLVTNNKVYGLHSFVVPIRDPNTLVPLPGVIVGDMGEKIGLNGIDNGFVIFKNYEIPRENLLNKLGDVTEDGQYVTPFKDPNKRHGAALGSLSSGRIFITNKCEAYMVTALTIAIRYGAVRKQFGPPEKGEVALLEYETHRYRLLPHLAATYVLRVFSVCLIETLYDFSINSMFGKNPELQAAIGVEIHGLSSASKPVAGWIARKAIQESRETCGGHGYLKVSGIGDVRNSHDANLIYEGENHILIQQTGNWLLKFWPLILKRKEISTPLKSANFLTNALDILQNAKFKANSSQELFLPDTIITMYQWVVCFLMKKTQAKLEKNLKTKSMFWARSEMQVYHAKNLSTAFIEHFMLQTFLSKINESTDASIQDALLRLFLLFGLYSLEKYIPVLYEGGYVTTGDFVHLLEESILTLCAKVKNDAVGLIDAVAPPDFVLNSVLGASDGEVYKRLEYALFSSPNSMSRPAWWQEVKILQKKSAPHKL